MRLLVRELNLSAVGIGCRIGGIATGLEPSKELLYLDSCRECCSLRKMSSIPQGAHAAAKVHMMMAEGNWSSNTTMMRNVKGRGNEKELPSSWIPWMNLFMDHPLAKYNSKMMNSIWGLYNRYSVHNFKRVTEEGVKGKAGEWMAPGSFTFNQKLQATGTSQSPSAAPNVGLPATAFPTASTPVRDANPLNSFWFGRHHH
ncbi:uncharacterized protein [Hetaerina americana]|uniref:uncharacterized protein n=1 Tax=Hetaerina americana TaxID=62018 RepID=UPI003A7F36D9